MYVSNTFLCGPKGFGGVGVEVRDLEERLLCMWDGVYVQGDGEFVVCEGGGEGQLEKGDVTNYKKEYEMVWTKYYEYTLFTTESMLKCHKSSNSPLTEHKEKEKGTIQCI